MEKRRRAAFVVTALLFAAAFSHRPLIDLRIDATPPRDAPARLQAAVDLGLAGVSILVTFGAERLAR